MFSSKRVAVCAPEPDEPAPQIPEETRRCTLEGRSDILDKSPRRKRAASPVSAPLAVDAHAGRTVSHTAAPTPANAERHTARAAKRRIEEQFWKEYIRTRSLEARNALWVHYQGLVRYIAESQKAKLPDSVDLQDLISAGNIGLLESLTRFDHTKGVRFETFCVPRIRGAMLDWIRSADWVPRLIRSKSSQFGRVVGELATTLGREPEDEEIAARLNMGLQRLSKLRKELDVKSQITFESDPERADHHEMLRLEKLEDPNTPDPTRDLQREEVRALASCGLHDNERVVIEQYYFGGRSMREIGAELGLSESRICQIHAQALKMLLRRFRPYERSCCF